MTVTLSNLKPEEGEEVILQLRDESVKAAEGRILSGRMDQYNDFGRSELQVEAFSGFEAAGGELHIQMPPCSVAEIRL